MKSPSAPPNVRFLPSSIVCIKGSGVVERTGLIVCQWRSRVTREKYTSRWMQTMVQEKQLKPGLTYWPVPTRPKSLTRWPVTRKLGSNSARTNWDDFGKCYGRERSLYDRQSRWIFAATGGWVDVLLTTYYAPYGLRVGNAPWFVVCWSRRFINSLLCVYFTSFLAFFFPYAFFYLFTSLLVSYLSTPSRMTRSVSRPEVVGGDQTWLYFLWLILCRSIFCYGCMFAFVVFVSVFQY